MLYGNGVKSLLALASAASIFVTSGAIAYAAPLSAEDGAAVAQVWTALGVDDSPAGLLTEAEADGLPYMREEEKLARDVYLALGEQWGTRIFDNISNSETAHMQAVKGLLDRYDLPDPAAGNERGVFTDPALQALYDQLVAQGSQSLAHALQVGATIEEIDILDLEKQLAATDRADIEMVYNNLLRGSQNHLNAFTHTLRRQTGVTYEPQYMTQDDFTAITSARAARGHGRRLGR